MSRHPPLTPALAKAIGETCIGTSVQRAARSLGRLYDAAFRPLGLSGWQFSLLMNLARPTPPTVSDLAEFLALDASTVTTNVKLLERRGLLAVEVDAADRRARRIRLTEAGRALLEEALPRWEEAQAASLARLREIDPGLVRGALSGLSDES
ncbi:MarR family winged helix-turn-helix transcriptional regulator [Methylobacterium sp. JK268]